MSAARYRKRPVIVEAIRYTGENVEEIQAFTGTGMFHLVHEEDRARADDPEITAEVMDDLHSTWIGVKDGQWIIRGVRGEFHPCDPSVFLETYLPAEPTITPTIAAHVLHHFDAGGIRAGSFIVRLIDLIAHADPANRSKLALGFPGYVNAVELAQNRGSGITNLLSIAFQGFGPHPTRRDLDRMEGP